MSERQSVREKRAAAIVAKAVKDDEYRENLLTNPRTTLQREFGKELPIGVEIRVFEDSPNVIHLVLPPKPLVELTDSDLQAVSGGFGAASSPIKQRTTGWYPLDEWLETVLM